ncbi:MAG: glycosyltransferase, partial [Ferruginibacter sp.]
MPKVYIIILNYKIWQDTVECLETVFRSVYENYTVIVIDNNSENDSLEELKHWAQNETNYANRSFSFSKMINKPVRYKYFREEEFSETTLTDQEQLILIKNEQNKGFAGGMNKVLEKLKKENSYIWLLNPDMVVEETTLAVLVE